MHIIIVRNTANSKALEASLLLCTYLQSQGITHTMFDSDKLCSTSKNKKFQEAVNEDAGLVVSLGGDGTLLLCARQIGWQNIPILGINYGTLGFLVNSAEDGVIKPVAAALAGDVVQEARTNLSVSVVCEGEADPYAEADAKANSQCNEPIAAHEFFALNEVAVTRGGSGRMVAFDFGIAGQPVANMRADGFVVASATGSTAYALSAGGPLVAPKFSGLVCVPIAPHTLHSRAVVTNPEDVVDVNIHTQSGRQAEETLFVDGNLIELEAPIKHVYVKRGKCPTTILRYNAMSFYERSAKVFF